MTTDPSAAASRVVGLDPPPADLAPRVRQAIAAEQIPDEAVTVDSLIAEHAANLQAIYDERTAGDHTFTGVLAGFLSAALPVALASRERPTLLFGDVPITERTPHGVWIADGPDPDRDPALPVCGGLRVCDDCIAYDALRQHLVEQVMLLDRQRQDETAALRTELEQHRSGESYEIGENYGRTTQANECVRELLDAVYPGDPMPDRSLDTVWGHLLEQVRKRTTELDQQRARAERRLGERDEALTKLFEQGTKYRDEIAKLRASLRSLGVSRRGEQG